MLDLINEVPGQFLRDHPLDCLVRLPGRDLKPEGYNPALVALAAVNNLVWVIRAAQQAQNMARSWRNYLVGAAALAYDFDDPAMGIHVGANIKPQQGRGLNLHAEQVTLAKVRRAGLTTVVALAVWGDPTDRDANPGQSPTLRPCSQRCDDMIASAPETTPETLILSANQDLSVCEFYTSGELHAYYTQADAHGPINEVPVYSLADDMDDDQYNNEIFLPYLVPKITALYSA